MVCKKCGGENVTIQVVNEVELKKKHKGIIYWLFFGWLIDIFLWLFLTLPRLIVAIFKPKKYKTKNKTVRKYVCQDCGYIWNG